MFSFTAVFLFVFLWNEWNLWWSEIFLNKLKFSLFFCVIFILKGDFSQLQLPIEELQKNLEKEQERLDVLISKQSTDASKCKYKVIIVLIEVYI